MVIHFWLHLFISIFRGRFWLETAGGFVCMILVVPSSWFRVVSVDCLFFKKQFDVNFLSFVRRRLSECFLSLAFDVFDFSFFNFSLNWLSNHWIFEQSIKHCKTWLSLGHCSVQLGGLMLRAVHRISTIWSWFRSFVEWFWYYLRLEGILRKLVFLLFLLFRHFLDGDFAIFNVIIHSINKFILLILT